MDRLLVYLPPGMELFGAAYGTHVSNRAKCTEMLKQGHLIGLAPGGGYEAQLATCQYEVLWKKRCGFAQVALDARVPIIPVFTENIREAFVTMETFGWLWQYIYNRVSTVGRRSSGHATFQWPPPLAEKLSVFVTKRINNF